MNWMSCGARYVKEHNLVGPIVRVINGYVSGLVLVGTALRLKKKYETYSSVLMGGVLFLVTISKLFFYDLAEAGTITKTVSFLSLGAILLLVSYLYNRYKDALFGTDKPGAKL